MPEQWTAWILDSRGALRVGRAVCAALAVWLLVAAAILLAYFGHGRATDGITWLLAPAIPTLVAGQVWAIAILLARLNRAEGGPPRWFVAAFFAGVYAFQLAIGAAELRRRRAAGSQALA
jgi:hypothetical protein